MVQQYGIRRNSPAAWNKKTLCSSMGCAEIAQQRGISRHGAAVWDAQIVQQRGISRHGATVWDEQKKRSSMQ